MYNFIISIEVISLLSFVIMTVTMTLDMFTMILYKHYKITFWVSIISFHTLLLGLIILMFYYGGDMGGYHGGFLAPTGMKVGGISTMSYIGY